MIVEYIYFHSDIIVSISIETVLIGARDVITIRKFRFQIAG